jgi:hypothetical protein
MHAVAMAQTVAEWRSGTRVQLQQLQLEQLMVHRPWVPVRDPELPPVITSLLSNAGPA